MARKAAKSRKKHLGTALLVLAGLIVVGVLTLAVVVKLTEASLPAVPSWDEYAASVPKVTRILASDGSVVREIFHQRRTLITPDHLPALLVNAILATEDAGFMEHRGLSYGGIARAMLRNVLHGRISQGGSTISQQVVKQILLTPERTWTRKFKELLLTRQLELKLSKKEILAIYLSHVYLGSGRYGFEEASRFFFGRGVHDLRVEEAAMLAGLVSAPEGNSMLRNPEGAVARQIHVLNRMAETGMLTAEQAETASRARLHVIAKDPTTIGSSGYFADAVERELRRLVGAGQLDTGGFTVMTSLDLAVSEAVEYSIGEGLSGLYRAGRTRVADEGAGFAGVEDLGLGGRTGTGPRLPIAKLAGCRRGDDQAFVTSDGVKKAVSIASIGRLGSDRGKQLDVFCDGFNEVQVSPGIGSMDTFHGKLEVVNAELGPQASFVVLDSSSRAVVAMVGGEDFASRPYNRAIQSSMPIGSTIKPFIYAAALMNDIPEEGGWVNEPVAFRGKGGRLWKPRNYGGAYDGRVYDMTGALKDSINVIAVKVLQQTGVEKVASLLESVGFKGHIPRDLSMALGSVEASPLDLANAYAVFGASGNLDAPWMIDYIDDFHGKRVFSHGSRPGRIIPAAIANRIRKMLRQVVLDGTARALDVEGIEVWGKTGTTNMSREAWFAGGFGRLVGVVLVAYDDRLPMRGATGGNTAVPIFKYFVLRYRDISSRHR